MSVFEGLRIPDLAGRAVLITGASTGIGAALVGPFVRQGARVALHYNSSAAEARAVADAAGGDVHLVQGDLSEQGASERVVAEAAERLGGLNGLINNAGGMLGRLPTDQLTDEQFEKVMNLNARSVLAATRSAHPLLKRDGGFVINTTSIAARNGGGGGAILYAAAKGFVSTLTRGHAKEFAPDNIRVNAVAPGIIETPFHDRYTSPEMLEAQRRSVPMERLGTPDECVGAFLFLASSILSGYVTGQVLEVNGGQLMP
ncbi:SDR family NAD(P)-dependent oxidoreductase [Rhizosaccharibacter radicis]|uniref:SDR family oxidoreductase n=1 Tax=Rhizosaccharibacter radicis TaxID=2782605 RepID=A0ABT1VV25_9PROT|nr:SDR family oxidoreductase [Acetobacteraceae bacterium KSS12]